MNSFHWSKRELILGGISFVAISLLCWQLFWPSSQADEPEGTLAWEQAVKKEGSEEQSDENEKPAGKEKTMIVDVKGAIKTSGVYEVEADNRVVDVIEKAGGFSKKADKKQINLAKQVRDEMVIYVPKKGEDIKAGGGIAQSSGSKQQEVIPLNTAKATELQELPGIGPQKSKAIIDYREEHGSFNKVEDLLNVTGIGEKTLEKLKDKLRL